MNTKTNSNMRYIFLLFTFLMTLFSCNNLNVDNEKQITINEIKDKTILFLVKDNQLETKLDLREYRSSIIIKKLINNTPIKNSTEDIYSVLITKSHSKQYILFVHENDIKVININELTSCMIELYDFLDHQQISRKKRNRYIEKLISFYKETDSSNYNKIMPKK